MVLLLFYELSLFKLLTLTKLNVKMVLFKPQLITAQAIHLMSIVTQDLILMNVRLTVLKNQVIIVSRILTLYSPNVLSVGMVTGSQEKNVTMETLLTLMDALILAKSTLGIPGIVTQDLILLRSLTIMRLQYAGSVVTVNGKLEKPVTMGVKLAAQQIAELILAMIVIQVLESQLRILMRMNLQSATIVAILNGKQARNATMEGLTLMDV